MSGVALVALVVATIATISALQTSAPRQNPKPQPPTPSVSATASAQPTPSPTYAGKDVSIQDGFTVTVPGGWRASVSTNPSFLGMQFARPGQLESLAYNASAQAAIDYNGIPTWSGLTEHFYIRRITTASQAFVPSRHAQVTSEPFTFSDGTAGTLYKVTKNATEAKQWGGLLKDNEWYGRVFIYERDGKSVEAHLAFYPSTKIDTTFYEKVAKSIKL